MWTDKLKLWFKRLLTNTSPGPDKGTTHKKNYRSTSLMNTNINKNPQQNTSKPNPTIQ